MTTYGRIHGCDSRGVRPAKQGLPPKENNYGPNPYLKSPKAGLPQTVDRSRDVGIKVKYQVKGEGHVVLF